MNYTSKVISWLASLLLLLCMISLADVGAEEVTYLVPGLKRAPAMAFDENGALLWEKTRAPFGENDHAIPGSRLGIDLYHKDAETKLSYAGARYYEPATTRSIQFDNGAINSKNPLAWNRYQFNNNNPLYYEDPDGNIPLIYVGYLVFKGAMFAWDAYDAYSTVSDANLSSSEKALSLGVIALGNLDPSGLTKHVRKAKVVPGPQSGRTAVLGHYPEYENLADSLGAKRFSIPEDVWSKMTSTQKWEANKKFLDRTIKAGDEVRLATPLNNIRPGSFYEKEIRYLIEQGYRPSADGLMMVPPLR